MHGTIPGRRLLAALIMGGTVMAEPATWYVSTQGNDAWSGILEKPNADGSDGPFATLERARDASRDRGGEARRIVLSEGRYFLDGTLSLDARDSGLSIEGAGQGKTVVYGGRRLQGWVEEGADLWSVSLPSDAPDWAFRVLVVNDTMRPRARYPEEGYLEHETTFPVRWMSTAGGGWERKPTMEEYTTMVYKRGDIPNAMRLENAEVTISHMWDESTLPVARHDPRTRTLTFADRGAHPPGAFGVKRYAVWNTREGLTRPGQWYLDKVERKVVYWSVEGEDMNSATVIAPTMVTLVAIAPGSGERPRNIAIRDLTLSTGDAPLTQAGFGGSKWPGTVHADGADGIIVERVEVTNSGVWGVRGGDMQVVDCHLHHLGGGGVKYWGPARIQGNHIHDIGRVSANCIGIMGGGTKSVVRRNVIHDTPYSGMSIGGSETLIEENELYRCMLVHHDGAAIYMGGGRKCIIRRNLARDMVQVGSGYGVSAYYLDEKCRDCVVAENVAIDIPHPAQNHMTLNCELRDNVFICKGDMKIAFARCSGHKVVGNTFHLEGTLNIREPDAIVEWRDNLIFTRNDRGGTVSEDVPRKPFVPRDKPRYVKPVRVDRPPVVDGRLGNDEWPGGGLTLGERPSQRSVRGAPTSVKIAVDDNAIYILTTIVTMFPEQRKLGTEWGRDEGVELAIQGRGEAGGLHVLRGFADGECRVSEVGDASKDAASAVAQAVSYAAGVEEKVWRSEWSVPLAALGIQPGEKTLVPFSLTAYRSEDNVFAQVAGTLGETWDVTVAGRLMLNWENRRRSTHPAVSVPTAGAPPDSEHWTGTRVSLARTPGDVPIASDPCAADLLRHGNNLLVRITVPTASVSSGNTWGTDDGAEVCIRGKTPEGNAVTWVIHGFANGVIELSEEAGAPASANSALQPKIRFSAKVGDDEWTAEWLTPMDELGVDTSGPVPFNLGVFRNQDRQWINWTGTNGPTWKLDAAGTIQFR